MNPRIFLWALGLFAAALAVHILAWRRRRPRRHLLALSLVFLAPAALFPAAFAWAGAGSAFDACAALLLYAATAAAYIQTYPAVQAMSPSLQVMRFLDRGPAAGRTREELARGLSVERMLRDRVQDLLDARLLLENPSNGRLRVAWEGHAILWPLILLRRALGLDIGRG